MFEFFVFILERHLRVNIIIIILIYANYMYLFTKGGRICDVRKVDYSSRVAVARRLWLDHFEGDVHVTPLAPFVASLKNLIIILLRMLAIAGNRSYLDKRTLYLSLNASAAREA